MKQSKLTIDIQIKEKDFIEGLLNNKYSDLIENKKILFILSLYALGKSWNINKLNYYINLLELNE